MHSHSEIFDLILIGRGLVGTAAAKHFSMHNSNVLLIGPDEPKDTESATVYASHYDQARIQRLIGIDDAWTKLNIESVRQYPSIEMESGIKFHYPVGCYYINPHGRDEYLNNAPSISKLLHCNYQDIDHYKQHYAIPKSSEGIIEDDPSGYIEPRNLLKAQQLIFQKNGGHFYNDIVTSVLDSNQIFKIQTSTNNVFYSKKILFALGSFFNYSYLLPFTLDMTTKSETIILAEVSESVALQMKHYPSLLYEIETHELDGIYLIQPVIYPDGKYYIKMGCNLSEDIYFEDLNQIQQWFRYGNSDRSIPKMEHILRSLLPHVQFGNIISKRCIISRTPHGRPYIGESKWQNVYIAGGCNGYSAMCSDGIGHQVAHCIQHGSMDHHYHPDDFNILYKD